MRVLTRREWKPLYAIWRADKLHLPQSFRTHAVRGCATKMRYESREEAIPVAKRLPPRKGMTVTIYACEICKIDGKLGFHIGNTGYRQSYGVNGHWTPAKESHAGENEVHDH